MSTSTSAPTPLPAFLDGRAKRLLIGGRWEDAAGGRTFPSIDPSTGRVIAELAAGDATDAGRAVTAARAALSGPWRTFSPRDRQALLWAFADKVQEHFDELRLLEALDMGSPLGRRRPGSMAWEAEVLRYYAGWATKIHGETTVRHCRIRFPARCSATPSANRSGWLPRSCRGTGRSPTRVEDRARAGDRVHHRPQTRRRGEPGRAAPRRAAGRDRHPRRRGEHRDR